MCQSGDKKQDKPDINRLRLETKSYDTSDCNNTPKTKEDKHQNDNRDP